MHATHSGILNYPTLPLNARHTYLVPELKSHPLISIGTLCDAGCKGTFDVTKMIVHHDNHPILTGHREPTTKLWYLDEPEQHTINTLTTYRATPPDLIAFAHASFFSPATSTMLKALECGYITGFPELSTISFKRHMPTTSTAMYKGHLDQVRKNIQSTQNHLGPQQSLDNKTTFQLWKNKPTNSPCLYYHLRAHRKILQ